MRQGQGIGFQSGIFRVRFGNRRRSPKIVSITDENYLNLTFKFVNLVHFGPDKDHILSSYRRTTYCSCSGDKRQVGSNPPLFPGASRLTTLIKLNIMNDTSALNLKVVGISLRVIQAMFQQ